MALSSSKVSDSCLKVRSIEESDLCFFASFWVGNLPGVKGLNALFILKPAAVVPATKPTAAVATAISAPIPIAVDTAAEAPKEVAAAFAAPTAIIAPKAPAPPVSTVTVTIAATAKRVKLQQIRNFCTGCLWAYQLFSLRLAGLNERSLFIKASACCV